MTAEIQPDQKGSASLTLGEVVRQTANNFPDSRFHPHIYEQTPYYTIAGIDPRPYSIWPTADGIGTKPELAEKLYAHSILQGYAKPELFESLAFDVMAMIESDEARFGRYMVGAANIIDVNSAEDTEVVGALARGLKRAADEGGFAILNGETAELGYRSSGYGDTRVNWNAVGISLVNPDKLILGKELEAGQPIVAFREQSIRSNGLTRARAILEADYFAKQGYDEKREYVLDTLAKRGISSSNGADIVNILSEHMGHDFLEQVLPPWHTLRPNVVLELLKPSTLYGPVIQKAQGRIDGPREVGMVAAAHISGGGVPEKAKRMVENKGLGVEIFSEFSDPDGVKSLMEIANNLPEKVRERLNINERTASEQWNRGIGFLVVTPNIAEADALVELSARNGREAAVVGHVINVPEIHWRGNVWKYAA